MSKQSHIAQMFIYEHLECVIKSKRNIPMHAGEKKKKKYRGKYD